MNVKPITQFEIPTEFVDGQYKSAAGPCSAASLQSTAAAAQ